jgi:hypothetical protein
VDVMFQVVLLVVLVLSGVLEVKRDCCGAECSMFGVFEKAIYNRIAILL